MSNANKYATLNSSSGRSSLKLLQQMNNESETVSKEDKLRKKYENLIQEGNRATSTKELEGCLRRLRTMILMEGLPVESEEERKNIDKKCSLRGRVWQILLKLKRVDANEYINLVRRGPCADHEKFMHDIFRTFLGRKEPELTKRVTEAKIIRVINAFLNSANISGENLAYCQGMNQLVSPFLYVMPELDAYFTFQHFVRTCCPQYYAKTPAIVGAYAGVELFSKVLKHVDPDLNKHFENCGFNPAVLMLRCVLAFNSTTPPMNELIKLWDFLLAFGVHLNIIMVVAQVVLIRDELLSTDKPQTLINERSWPRLNAEHLINVAIQLLRQLPENLYRELVEHPFKAGKKKPGTLPKNFKARGSPKLSANSIFGSKEL